MSIQESPTGINKRPRIGVEHEFDAALRLARDILGEQGKDINFPTLPELDLSFTPEELRLPRPKSRLLVLQALKRLFKRS